MKQSKIFLVAAIVISIIAITYSAGSESLLNVILQKTVLPVEWQKVHPRDIIKNSVPIIILEDKFERCLVSVEKLDIVLDHRYFVHSSELESKLNFDRENNTLEITCSEIPEPKSRLHIWYVTSESSVYPERYEYFITPWDDVDATPPR